MGFNKRKMEDARKTEADKEAAERRGLEYANPRRRRAPDCRLERAQAERMPMLFAPTIGAAIAARHWWLWVRCPACHTTNAIDLRTLDRHPDAAITSLYLRCPADRAGRMRRLPSWCSSRGSASTTNGMWNGAARCEASDFR